MEGFDFQEMSATKAEVKPKGNIVPQVIRLELNLKKSRLTIEAPLGPLNNIDLDVGKILLITTQIEGYLALGRSEKEELLVHRLSLTTDQDLNIKPAVFHQNFSGFLRSFYDVYENLFQEKKSQVPRQTDDVEEKVSSNQTEPIGFHA